MHKKQRQVALFRGINVGKARRVKMAELRASIEKLGFAQVRTLLNSGNVVYTSDGVEPAEAGALIEKTLLADQGVPSRVTVVTQRELEKIASDNPLSDATMNPSRLQVAFLADRDQMQRLTPLLQKEWDPEALAVGDRVAYLYCPDGLTSSALMNAAGKALGTAVTVRSWATVLKIRAALNSET